MAKRTAKKTSRKLTIDLDDIEIDSKTKSTAKRAIKKTGTKTLMFALVFLIFGVTLGAGTWWLVCRDDCFSILGQEEITLDLSETYEDEGVKVVAFGKDEGSSVVIESNLKQNKDGDFYADEEGTYYIKYQSTCFKYGTVFKIQKVRLVTFTLPEGGAS
ncbi:MAG: hypothetical protein J6K39_04195 [Clostridia bacterium]|nr:hypothetical protein [Clostridia bacterium]